MVAEALEFLAIDDVLGGLESGAQRRNVVHVLVDPVLQDHKMVAGARAEFLVASRFSR
jgi:hypothetical protein